MFRSFYGAKRRLTPVTIRSVLNSLLDCPSGHAQSCHDTLREVNASQKIEIGFDMSMELCVQVMTEFRDSALLYLRPSGFQSSLESA